MQSAKRMFEVLNIEYAKEFEPFYKKGIELYENAGSAAFDADRIRSLSGKYNIFRTHLDKVLGAAERIKRNKELCVFVYFLCELIREKEPLLAMLQMPDAGSAETDFAPLFSLFFYAEDIIGAMEKRKIPADIISDTLYEFDAKITDYYNITGRFGARSYVGWLSIFVQQKIVRIGRFNFEMKQFNEDIAVYEKDGSYKILPDNVFVKQNGMLAPSAEQGDSAFFADIKESGGALEGYAVNRFGECTGRKILLEGYKRVLGKGDRVLSVHIPSNEPLDSETCEASYKNARGFFAEYYPEFDYKAFICCSWLMDKRLNAVLGREGNITRFAERYMAFPRRVTGRDVYKFVFLLDHETAKVSDMPENTSLQRAIKKHYMAGGYIYEKGGVFF